MISEPDAGTALRKEGPDGSSGTPLKESFLQPRAFTPGLIVAKSSSLLLEASHVGLSQLVLCLKTSDKPINGAQHGTGPQLPQA